MSDITRNSKNGTEGLWSHGVTQGHSAFFCCAGRGSSDYEILLAGACAGRFRP